MKDIAITSISEEKFRNYFISDHSKFIHGSWLIKEDLDREVVIDGHEWRIAGLWDLVMFRREILLRGKNGQYAIEESKVIANALGHFNMRNLVNGEEHKGWVFDEKSKNLIPIEQEFVELDSETDLEKHGNAEEANDPGVWASRDRELLTEEDDSDDVDPLVKTLQKSLSDEDND